MSKQATAAKYDLAAFQTTDRPIRRKLNMRTPLGKISNQWVAVEHERDPKQVILDAIGIVDKRVAEFSRILVALYQPPMVAKTAGGIILTDALTEEDRTEYIWQGKVGLIVAMGSQAYVDDETTKFHGIKHEIGDWVWFMPSNGQTCWVNEVPCRLFQSEAHINGGLPHPDYIW